MAPLQILARVVARPPRRLDSPQRTHDLREVFNAMRWLVRTGASWRVMPNDLPPWPAVFQQMQRWMRAGCFEALVHDLRVLLRVQLGRAAQPTAMILDSRTLQSTPESRGARGLRRREAAQGCEGPRGRRHAGSSARAACDARERARPGAGGRVGRRRPHHHRPARLPRVRGSGLYRRRPRTGGRRPRDSTGRGYQAHRSEAGLCPAAPAVGRGAHLRLGRAFPPPRPATTNAWPRRSPPITRSRASCSRARWLPDKFRTGSRLAIADSNSASERRTRPLSVPCSATSRFRLRSGFSCSRSHGPWADAGQRFLAQPRHRSFEHQCGTEQHHVRDDRTHVAPHDRRTRRVPTIGRIEL